MRLPSASRASLEALGRRMGRTPVVVRDAPGFLVNLGGRAYTTEAMRILQERAATEAQVDAIMRDCCGFRMGPFELADLTGMDVNYPVSQIVYDGYMHDARLRTSFAHRALLEAGRLGRKSGRGNYCYDAKGQKSTGDDSPVSGDYHSDAAPARAVFLIEPDDRLRDFANAFSWQVLDGDDGTCALLAAPCGEDATGVAVRTGCDHGRLVAVDLYCDTASRVTLMCTPGVDGAVRDGVAAAIMARGRAVTLIKDTPGFVSQRIRALIAALGCEMAQMQIAGPEAIDLAMRLGLNYPLGPLELAADMGLANTVTMLENLQAATGDDRYRVPGWLRRRAALGLPVYQPD